MFTRNLERRPEAATIGTQYGRSYPGHADRRFRAGGIRAERKAGGMQIVLFGAPPLQLLHGREGG